LVGRLLRNEEGSKNLGSCKPFVAELRGVLEGLTLAGIHGYMAVD